jgi:NAD(P)H-nitrite reductase large subunit
VPGYDLPEVYNFKSLSAARSLVERARHGEVTSALIVGAGFIGVEVALLLSDLGLAVTMVQRRWVMPRMLDPETGGIVLDALRARGVEVHLHTTATAFVGEDHVESVAIESGEELRADVYIAATGVKPNVDWLSGSELDVGWGIRVDECLRTNLPNVYAAGDVAETRDRMTGDRYVHAIFPNAVEQGRIVASQLLGYEAGYEGSETMNSLRHLGIPLIAAGAQTGGQELRYRQGDTLRKLFLDDGRIVGFRLAGDVRGAGFYRSLMLKRMDVGSFSGHLLDPRFGYGSVALGSHLI